MNTKLEMPDVLVVDVTAEDIDQSRRFNHLLCPIALACRRMLPWRQHPGVNSKFVRLLGVRYELPLRGQQFVKSFDDYGPDHVRPLTLTLTRE